MSGETATSETARLIMGKRTRAIEQIKRLYAVVMGFSVTVLIGNVYSVVKSPGFDYRTELPFFVAESVCFASLISLFYLGAERMLDARYLEPDSPVATWHGLLMDGASLGTQAIMFVLLANTVPDLRGLVPSALNPSLGDMRLQLEQDYQISFVWNLMFFNLVDLLFLSFQWSRIKGKAHQHIRREQSDLHEAYRAHLIWSFLNVVSICVLYFAMRWSHTYFACAGFTVNGLSAAVLILHIVRFFTDFCSTFRFYYPPDPLPTGIAEPRSDQDMGPAATPTRRTQ